MYRAATATAIIALLGTPALADSAPGRWSGPYIGFNAGYGNGTSKFNCISDNDCSELDGRFRLEGASIGAQIGHNWILSNGMIAGLEADFSLSGIQGDAFFGGKHQSSDLNHFGTVRGRLGKEISPGMLAFATAGLAYGNFTDGMLLTTMHDWTTTRLGWTAGFGIEKELGERVSLKFDYLYMDFGRANHNFSDNVGFTDVTGTARFDNDLHTFRVGLNFKLP